MSTATSDFNHGARCQHSRGARRWRPSGQNPIKCVVNDYYSPHRREALFLRQDAADSVAMNIERYIFVWIFMGHTHTHTQSNAACHIVFDALSAGESRRLLRCPPGSGEQSGLSHSLSSQDPWASAHSAANCSLAPRLFCWANYEYSSRHESNSVRHATVRPHSVSSAVCSVWGEKLTKSSPSLSFVIRLGDKIWL